MPGRHPESRGTDGPLGRPAADRHRTPAGRRRSVPSFVGFQFGTQMAYIQRPGAQIIASEFEWKKEGRNVQPDAVPIIILWPRCPIRFVYELEDTGPPIDRREINEWVANLDQQ
jgi:hypothetical protein